VKNMAAKRRRQLLRMHIDRKPEMLTDWMTPEQVMFEMIENPLSSLSEKHKSDYRACSTHNYVGMTRRSIATLLSELCRKGILERKDDLTYHRVSEYRRKVL
tara:strand:+ start:653 stop:958 length:306 start_codon:yes stop_codon:yes gene_type:complete